MGYGYKFEDKNLVLCNRLYALRNDVKSHLSAFLRVFKHFQSLQHVAFYQLIDYM
ncbi:hypothetical protein e1116g03.tmp0171 [Eimeria tenella]|uniref:Uncharacterized protein n=1 Tax=Eimeria tenella TaxID=5802 RepID=C8TE50_EIMTE|nr:hypothetical protein e1116g03.tmp0171 [Eimeria tenella]